MAGFPTRDFLSLLPVAILTVGAIALLLSEVFLVSGRRGYQAVLTVVFAAAAAIAAAALPAPGAVFGRQAVGDQFSVFITVIVCAGLALSAIVVASWLEARSAERGGDDGLGGGGPRGGLAGLSDLSHGTCPRA